MNAHLVSYRNGEVDLVFALAESGAAVGRDAGCLVQAPDSRVSKRHALIRMEGGRWVVEDLGSRNGTRVNGEKIAEATEIKHGDKIGFGPAEFEFSTDEFGNTSFAPGHVIDLSSKAAQQTMQREQPNSSASP